MPKVKNGFLSNKANAGNSGAANNSQSKLCGRQISFRDRKIRKIEFSYLIGGIITFTFLKEVIIVFYNKTVNVIIPWCCWRPLVST